MSLKENLTFWDGVEMTLLFMVMALTLGFYLWEMHLSPYAREEKRKKKEKIKETQLAFSCYPENLYDTG